MKMKIEDIVEVMHNKIEEEKRLEEEDKKEDNKIIEILLTQLKMVKS